MSGRVGATPPESGGTSTTNVPIQDLGSPGISSVALDLNNKTQVVGSSNNTAVRWDEQRGMVALGVSNRRSGATSINDRGTVAGYRYNDNNHRRAVIWKNENLHELGTLGGNESSAVAVNNRDTVVGWSETSTGVHHPFEWTEKGGMADLGALIYSARDINSKQQITGFARNTPNSTNQAVILETNDEVEYLGTLGGSTSIAYGINRLGSVVGGSRNSNGKHRAFLSVRNDDMYDLGSIDTSSSIPSNMKQSEAYDINDRGVVVGRSRYLDREYHAVQWDSNRNITDLGTLGGEDSDTNGVNNHGTIAGSSQLEDSNRRHAVIWNPE